MIFSKLLLPFLKKEKKKERNGESSSNRQKCHPPPSFLRDLGLSAWRSAWASVSTSGPIEDDRSRRYKVAASHLGFEPLDRAASRVLPEEGGRRKSRVGEGKERTSGQVEARRWSGRVACRVWKREWPKAHSAPSPPPPTPAPLVLVSSWKSIAGKRVKIHPCPRKNLTQGWTGSAGGGLKSEKEGKGWRGKEREEEGGREWKRLRWRDLGETRFTYLGVVLPTLSGSPLLAETCLVCAILAFTALKHRRSLAGKNSTGMELPRIGTSWMGWNFGGFNLGAIYIFSLSTAIFARE